MTYVIPTPHIAFSEYDSTFEVLEVMLNHVTDTTWIASYLQRVFAIPILFRTRTLPLESVLHLKDLQP